MNVFLLLLLHSLVLVQSTKPIRQLINLRSKSPEITPSPIITINGRRLHGFMTSPVIRGGTPTGVGQKISGTGAQVDLTGCNQGDTENKGAVPPTAANTFKPGQQIPVTWKTTITHPNAPGVRIALKYKDKVGDTFAAHILKDGLDGSKDGTETITLPTEAGVAELMWSWASTADGGYYVGCADIEITAAAVAPGNNQNGGTTNNNNNGGVNGNNNNQNTGTGAAAGDGGSTVVIVICIIIMIGSIGGVVYFMQQQNNNGSGGGHSNAPAVAKKQEVKKNMPRIKSMRPKSIAKGLRASGNLPSGWHATVDGEGDTYYYHDNGSTSWEVPK